jgi:hypothetical protein
MSTTIGTLEKNIEKVISTLSPEELAKLLSEEVISISNNQAAGKDQDARFAETIRIYEQHVLTKDWPVYAKFWRTMHEEDIRYWSWAYFTSMLDGIAKQDALIVLLIRAESTLWITRYKDYLTHPNKEIKDILEHDRQEIKCLLKRRQEIRQAINEMIEAGFWEQWNIPRPSIDMAESDEFLNILNDVEQWITTRDLDKKIHG